MHLFYHLGVLLTDDMLCVGRHGIKQPCISLSSHAFVFTVNDNNQMSEARQNYGLFPHCSV